MRLGEYLRRYRCENKITQEELANQLGCHASHISFIENGWSDKCTFRNFVKIIVLLNLKPEEVFDILMTFHKLEAEKDAKRNC